MKIFILFALLCALFCACNASHEQVPETLPNTAIPSPTEISDVTDTTAPEELPIPDEYLNTEFPIDIIDKPQNPTEPAETEPVEVTEPVTEPTEPVTEPTEPVATTNPGFGFELPEDVFD